MDSTIRLNLDPRLTGLLQAQYVPVANLSIFCRRVERVFSFAALVTSTTTRSIFHGQSTDDDGDGDDNDTNDADADNEMMLPTTMTMTMAMLAATEEALQELRRAVRRIYLDAPDPAVHTAMVVARARPPAPKAGEAAAAAARKEEGTETEAGGVAGTAARGVDRVIGTGADRQLTKVCADDRMGFINTGTAVEQSTRGSWRDRCAVTHTVGRWGGHE